MSFFAIGHRGVLGVEPENTIRSFLRAEREKLDGIELDLHLSKDGSMVVMHDETVDRTTDGRGAVNDLTVAELRKLDAGQGEQIPLFEEVLEAVGPDLAIQAEIKDVKVSRVLARLLKENDLLDRVSVLSFIDEALHEFIDELPGARMVLVADPTTPDLVERAQAVGSRLVSVDMRRVNLDAVDRCRAVGIDVMAWSVNDARDLAVAQSLGLVGAVTDFPEVRQLILER